MEVTTPPADLSDKILSVIPVSLSLTVDRSSFMASPATADGARFFLAGGRERERERIVIVTKREGESEGEGEGREGVERKGKRVRGWRGERNGKGTEKRRGRWK